MKEFFFFKCPVNDDSQQSENKILKQSWLPAVGEKIENTQNVKKSAFWLNKVIQKASILEEIIVFKAAYCGLIKAQRVELVCAS